MGLAEEFKGMDAETVDKTIDAMESDIADVQNRIREYYKSRPGGKTPSEHEIDMDAYSYMKARGDKYDYFTQKKIVQSRPGAVQRTWDAIVGGAKADIKQIARPLAHALTDRTRSLRSEDSSFPTFSFNRPQPFGSGYDPNAPLVPATDNPEDDLWIQKLLPNPPSRITIGPEQLADTLEMAGPMLSEAGALSSRVPGPYKIPAILAGNVVSEVGAEAIRFANAKASGVDTGADSDTPQDIAYHFLNTALGGAILGAGDTLFNFAGHRTQRAAYKQFFGLGTKESDDAIARLTRLGVEPNLAQASVGFARPLFAAMAAFPLTGKGNIEQSKKLVSGVASKARATFEDLEDPLTAGIMVADKSAAWIRANDHTLQWYARRESATWKKFYEQDLPRFPGAYVDHAPAKAQLQPLIDRMIESKILVRRVNKYNQVVYEYPKSHTERRGDFQLILDFMNGVDHQGIQQYRNLRQGLNKAAASTSDKDSTTQTLFRTAAALTNDRLDNMVAPDELKNLYIAAKEETRSLAKLQESPAWSAFRSADPDFGKTYKELGQNKTLSPEAVLDRALGSSDLTPDILRTWHQVAREGNAEAHFKGAIASHLEKLVGESTTLAAKGPFAGLDVVNVKSLFNKLGLDNPRGTTWDNHETMIRLSGGDPKALKQFLEDASVMFPDGMINPSQTAARRTALSGLQSGASLALGIGVLGGYSTVPRMVASLVTLVGLGKFAFDPKVLNKMSRIMKGGMSEQGAVRTLWGIASSYGVVRGLQSSLQGMGIDPREDFSKYELQALDEARRQDAANLRMGKTPLMDSLRNGQAPPPGGVPTLTTPSLFGSPTFTRKKTSPQSGTFGPPKQQ